MKTNHIKTVIFITIFLMNTFIGVSQIMTTHEDNSPVVIAKNIAVRYGFNTRIVMDLLEIYKKKGLSIVACKKQTQLLLANYKSVKPTSGYSKLSKRKQNKLGIRDNPEIIETLNFQTYLSTQGNNSPVIYNQGGDVAIWYGISPKAFMSLINILNANKNEVVNLEEQLKLQVKNFKDLQNELSKLDNDLIAKRALKLLNKGEIVKAEKLLEDNLLFHNRSLAFRHYHLAKIQELLLKFQKATEHFLTASTLLPENWEYFMAYLQNLYINSEYDHLIYIAERKLETNNSTQLKTADLQYLIGKSLNEKGLLTLAKKYAEKSQIIRQKELNISHTKNLEALNLLGDIYYNLDEFDTSLKYHNSVLNILNKYSTPNKALIASTFFYLGKTKYNLGDKERAFELFKKALQLRLEVFDKNHPVIARSYNSLGIFFNYIKEYKLSLEYHEKSLDLRKKTLTKNHPQIGHSYINIANVYKNMTEYHIALNYYKNALNIFNSVFEENHNSIAIIYDNIAEIYSLQQNYDTALDYNYKSLFLREKNFDGNNIFIMISHNKIARTLKAKKEYDKSLKHLNESLKIYNNSSTSRSILLNSPYDYIGDVFYDQKKYDEAYKNYLTSLNNKLNYLGSQDNSIAHSYKKIGLTFSAKKDYSKAIEYFENSLKIYLNTPFANYSNVINLYSQLGDTYFLNNEIDCSLETYNKKLEFIKRKPEKNNTDILQTYQRIALVYLQKKEYIRALEILKRASNDSQKKTIQNISIEFMIGYTYQRQKEYNTAFLFYSRAEEIRKELNSNYFKDEIAKALKKIKKHIIVRD